MLGRGLFGECDSLSAGAGARGGAGPRGGRDPGDGGRPRFRRGLHSRSPHRRSRSRRRGRVRPGPGSGLRHGRQRHVRARTGVRAVAGHRAPQSAPDRAAEQWGAGRRARRRAPRTARRPDTQRGPARCPRCGAAAHRRVGRPPAGRRVGIRRQRHSVDLTGASHHPEAGCRAGHLGRQQHRRELSRPNASAHLLVRSVRVRAPVRSRPPARRRPAAPGGPRAASLGPPRRRHPRAAVLQPRQLLPTLPAGSRPCGDVAKVGDGARDYAARRPGDAG